MSGQGLHKLLKHEDLYDDQLAAFDSLGLAELEEVGLLKRCETKFVFKEDKLALFLESIPKAYDILEIDNVRLFSYSNIYYDTPELAYFRSHVNGRSNRHKVRIRNYLDTSKSFLEVKKRNIKGGLKYRLPLKRRRNSYELSDQELSEASKRFIDLNGVTEEELRAVMKITYKRITVVSKDRQERATIDVGLRCKNFNGDIAYFPGLAILELKQKRFSRASLIVRNLRDLRVMPRGISKYCLGTIKLSPENSFNRYKPRILALNKIMNQ